MDALKKILFIHPDLKGGGAERVLVHLVNALPKDKYQVTLFTIFKEGINKKLLHPVIKHFYWFTKVFRGYSVLQKIIPASFLANRLKVNDYDIVVAYLEHVPTRILSGITNPKVKKIAWLHTKATPELLSRTFRTFEETKNAYQSFNHIVCVSQEVKNSLLHIFPQLENKTLVIENTIDFSFIEQKAQEGSFDIEFDSKTLNIVSIGRLIEVKGYERLIQIVKRIASSTDINFKLYIIGDGELASKLNATIKKENIENYVQLLGFKENPYPYLAKADLYVCSSFTEGYNSAIIEALALEIPVLTTDCPGMNEILDKGKFGKIVPNTTEDLYKGLVELITQSEELNLLKLQAKERAVYLKAQNSTRSVEHLFDMI